MDFPKKVLVWGKSYILTQFSPKPEYQFIFVIIVQILKIRMIDMICVLIVKITGASTNLIR